MTGQTNAQPHRDTPSSDTRVVVLAGGTGGAKLARGMLDVIDPRSLTVIANTADDIDIYGARVSPDPDLICFWLADIIDERGWGLHADTFVVMSELRKLGMDVWFNLGDRDLAWCLRRSKMEGDGMSPTASLRALSERIGVRASVLPMCDTPVRTFVDGLGLQEFMIRKRGRGPVRQVRFDAPQAPKPTPEVLKALGEAHVVVIGPSNPVISIWPILTVLGDTIRQIEARVICVSPVVDGLILKGPTEAMLRAYGHPLSASGVIAFYQSVCENMLDGVVTDEKAPQALPTLTVPTRMDDAKARAALAAATVNFALSLNERPGST